MEFDDVISSDLEAIDNLFAHLRVSGFDFIPGGFKIRRGNIPLVLFIMLQGNIISILPDVFHNLAGIVIDRRDIIHGSFHDCLVFFGAQILNVLCF